MTKTQEAVRQWFKVDPLRDRLGNQPPLPGIFPAHDAPVIRKIQDSSREAVRLNWGFVLVQPGRVAKRVTNARWDKVQSSGFWKPSLAEWRCLVPVTSFAEPDGKKPATWYWFAQPPQGDDARPLFSFAGVWRQWKGSITVKGEEIVNPEIFSILTVPPNEIVNPIHKKAMPVMLTTQEQADQWIDGTVDEAMQLAKPAPADELQIVHSGETADAA